MRIKMNKEKLIYICDNTVKWCFYALIVVVTFSISLVEIASTLMLAAWLVRVLASRDFKSLNTLPIKLLFLYFLWTILSCVNSDYAKESFRGIFKVAEYSLIFVAMATTVWKKSDIKRFISFLAAGTIMVCTNGFIQRITGVGIIRHRTLTHMDHLRRISSSFVHPNDFGGYLATISIIFIALVLVSNIRLRSRIGAAALGILSLSSLFFTRSRAAWLSFAAAFLVLGALRTKKMVAIFLVLLLLVFIMLPYTVQKEVVALADFKSGTTWERVMLWKGTINMIEVHPLLGFGINTYSRNFPKYKPPEYPDVRYAHNSYLQMASEIGIVGALLFIGFIITVLICSFKEISEMNVGLRKGFATGLFAGLVGFSMNCIVDTHLYSVTLAVFFHVLLGFCFALSCHAQEN